MTEVAAALIWNGDRLLICQRPAHKSNALLWEFVGGKLEKGETKQEALVRECMEELGVTVEVGDEFCIISIPISLCILPCSMQRLQRVRPHFLNTTT